MTRANLSTPILPVTKSLDDVPDRDRHAPKGSVEFPPPYSPVYLQSKVHTKHLTFAIRRDESFPERWIWVPVWGLKVVLTDWRRLPCFTYRHAGLVWLVHEPSGVSFGLGSSRADTVMDGVEYLVRLGPGRKTKAERTFWQMWLQSGAGERPSGMDDKGNVVWHATEDFTWKLCAGSLGLDPSKRPGQPVIPAIPANPIAETDLSSTVDSDDPHDSDTDS